MNTDRSAEAEAAAPDPAVSTEHQPPPTEARIVGAATEPPHGASGASGVSGAGTPGGAGRGALPRLLAIALGGAGLAYCVVFLQNLGSVVAPIFLALNLMVTAHPLHTALAKRGVNRSIAAVVTGLVVLAVLSLFFAAIGWAITQLVTTLPDYSTQFQALLTSITEQLARIGITPDTMLKQIQSVSPASALGVITPVFANLSTGAALLTVMVGVATVLVTWMVAPGLTDWVTEAGVTPSANAAVGSATSEVAATSASEWCRWNFMGLPPNVGGTGIVPIP